MTLSRFTVAFALALSPLPALAQGKCEIDEKKPNQVKDAASALAKVALPIGKPEDKLKSIQQAVGLLSKDQDKIIAANPLGRSYVLGRAYALYAELAMGLGRDSAMVVKRSAVGLLTEPDATIDLVASADEAFDAVEASNAACKDDTEEFRRRMYAPLVNAAVNLYNQQQLDSAGALVKRGLSVYDGYRLAYIAYNILGNVQQSKDQVDGAVDSFKKMASLMKGDTSQVDERKNVMLNVGQLIMAQAENLEGDAKKAKFSEASTYLETFLAEFPGDAKAQGALARAQIASGNTAAADKVFGDMVASPDKYSDGALFEAGVNAARANRPVDAAALFNAGLKKNVASRDGLFNLAVTLQKLEKWNEVPPILDRLVVVDPENPENYQLWALYFQSQASDIKKKTTAFNAAQKAKKTPATAADRQAATDLENQQKAANDSLMKYFKRFSEATVKLTVNLWAHDGNKHTLGGAVENLTEAEKSYTVTFEFLDGAGNVVTTKAAEVGAVAGKKSKAFRVEVEGAGVVAYRYKPIGG
ncbi:MAG: FxLYD domain-containing protein [Gemmatimonadaceae bacterium]